MIIWLVPVGVLAAAIPPVSSTTPPGDREEARLARSLAGRVAGPAQPCLPQVRLRGSRIVDRVAIIYESVDRTLWVNRPAAGRSALDGGKIVVTRTGGGRLCRNAVVSLVDRYARVETGQAVLGDFIPYRVAAAARGP